VHTHQTCSPQLLVRLSDRSYEPVYRKESGPFQLTLVDVQAALPNLYAEVLHPEVHWTTTLDNSLPAGDELEEELGRARSADSDFKEALRPRATTVIPSQSMPACSIHVSI